MSVNWADDEGRHERLAMEPDDDLPDLADVIDITATRVLTEPARGDSWGPAEDARLAAIAQADREANA